MPRPTCFLHSPCALPGSPRRRAAAVCAPRRGGTAAPTTTTTPFGRLRTRACASAPHQQDQDEEQLQNQQQAPTSPAAAAAAASSAAATAADAADAAAAAAAAAAAVTATRPEAGESGDPERRARLAEARLEAERLELLAAQAALASERAQLVAERKRLELDKLRAKHEGATVPKKTNATAETQPNVESSAATVADSGLPTTAAEPAPDLAAPSGSTPNADGVSKTSPVLSPKLINELLGVDFPRLAESDIVTLKEKVCSMNTFYVTHVERSPFDERVVFRGNLRVDSAVALAELEAAAKREGLEDRVRLFLLMDPKEPSMGDKEKPVIVALPAAALPNQTTVPATILSVVAALATIFSALSYGIGIFGLNPVFLDKLATSTLEVQQALYTLPISVGALAIVLAHEVSHRIAALYHDIKLGLPVFLPSLQVGTYGTITPLQSYPRNRTGLFDFAASGPIAGAAISIVTLIAGLLLTSTGEVADWFPQIPSALFNGSILVGTLGNLILPAAMRDQATLAVHPLLVVGYTGLLVNALNLIPIGRLDGGRIVQALFGRTVAGRVSGLTFVIQGLATIVGNSSLLLYWSLICVFLQREGEYPCQDEVTEPNNVRFVTGLGLLVLMILVLTPIPDQVGRLWA